jgi:hypothetical protein
MRTPWISIILLPLALALTQCQPASPPPESPAPPPIASQLVVEPAIAQAVQQAMAPYLASTPYLATGGGVLRLYVVSSGGFEQSGLPSGDGQELAVDTLIVYALMNNQRVLAVPLVIGLQLADGSYAYFSEKYAFDSEGQAVARQADREAALVDARERLPAGRIVRLLAYEMVSPRDLRWEACEQAGFLPQPVCQSGGALAGRHPGANTQFILRTAAEQPAGWLLVGWLFQEFALDELAPGISPDIPLPGGEQS